MYLSLLCHHQNDSCMKMGSDESHFNVSLTVGDFFLERCTTHTRCSIQRHLANMYEHEAREYSAHCGRELLNFFLIFFNDGVQNGRLLKSVQNQRHVQSQNIYCG